MNDLHDKELSALFSGDSEALVDEAFVDRCVTSIRRAHRLLLIAKLIIACLAVGVVSLVPRLLADLIAIDPQWLSTVLAAIDGRIGRAIIMGAVLGVIVWRFGLPSFRLRQTRL